MILGLLVRTGSALISAGMWLEDRAMRPSYPRLDAETDSCLRCRGNIVLSAGQLAGLLLRASEGVPVATLQLEADVLRRVGKEG